MGIKRWDPLRDLLSLQERVNRLFEDSLSRVRLDHPIMTGEGWVPLADVCETAAAFVVEIEVPGITERDLEIRVDADRVTVKGRRALHNQLRPESFQRLERSYGSFTRAFPFPEPIEPKDATHVIEDGVLRIAVPKARPRRRSRPAEGE